MSSRCSGGVLSRVQVQKRRPFLVKLALLSAAIVLLMFTISCTSLYIVNNQRLDEAPTAERLSSIVVEKQQVELISPRPFMNEIRGVSPVGFLPSYGPPSTSRKKTPPIHPHNIQDIIQFLTEHAHRTKELMKEENFANSVHENYHSYRGFSQHHPDDPFFNFKPQDPSDINLLAPNNFRFAPFALETTANLNKKVIPEQTVHKIGNTKKPLSLTLNIYPSSFDEGKENGKIRFPHGQRSRNSEKNPNKMVLHLNLYSNKEEEVKRKFSFN